MINFFFSKIPNLLFEPIAVTAFLGGISAVVANRKKRNPFFWSIALAICVMCFWRMAAHSLMQSSRYASIFLYPAIIFSIYFCFQTKDYLDQINRKFLKNGISFPGKLQTAFLYFLISGLAIACLIKTLHYSPYTNHTIKICEVLKKEVPGKNFLVYTHTDENRIAYYAGIDYKKVWLLSDKEFNSIHELLKQKLFFSQNFLEEIYVVFYLKKNEPEPDAQNLGIDPSVGKWEYLHREYTSRRKNKEMVLYRFIPAHPNIELWEKSIPEISPDNLYINGDFEQVLSGKELEERLDYYTNQHASDFYLTPGRLFPKFWWLGVPQQGSDGRSPEIALTKKQPIDGNYSLEINGNEHGLIGTNSVYIPKQDGTLSGYIHALEDSIVLINFNCWRTDQKDSSIAKRCVFHAAMGNTYRFAIPFHETEVNTNVTSVFTIIQSSDHVLIDNVEFIPDKTDK